MFRRLIKAIRSNQKSTAGRQFVEQMEGRQLMAAAPIVTNVIADNRGEVLVSLSRFTRNVNKNSVRFFTAGTDGTIGTADDVRKTDISVSFNTTNNRITIRGNTDSNATYRIRLESSLMTTADGKRLDGEYTGTFPSGDGNSGGNFNFVARRDRSNTPTVRMTTSLGVITLRMRRDVAPVSATAFLDIANSGDYDGFFWTRAIAGFVLQGGSLQVTGAGTSASDVVANSATQFPEELPRTLSNVRGTLSFARGGAQALASNQFFINVANNNVTDPNRNNLDIDTDGGPGDAVFTPFAEVIDGLSVADAVVAKPTANLSSQIGFDPSTGTSDVPVNDTTQAQAGLNPNRDLLVARRVAVRMKGGAL